MTGLKAMCIAFSIYSKIPVPIFKWEEKEMKYQLIFFPVDWCGNRSIFCGLELNRTTFWRG